MVCSRTQLFPNHPLRNSWLPATRKWVSIDVPPNELIKTVLNFSDPRASAYQASWPLELRCSLLWIARGRTTIPNTIIRRHLSKNHSGPIQMPGICIQGCPASHIEIACVESGSSHAIGFSEKASMDSTKHHVTEHSLCYVSTVFVYRLSSLPFVRSMNLDFTRFLIIPKSTDGISQPPNEDCLRSQSDFFFAGTNFHFNSKYFFSTIS